MSDYSIIETESELSEMLDGLAKSPQHDPMNPPILDLETYSAGPGLQANDVLTAKICGAAICYNDTDAYYIPLAHLDGNNIKFERVVEDVEAETFKMLEPYLLEWDWSNHMSRFDEAVIRHNGYAINYKYCTYVQAFLSSKFTQLFRSGQGGSDAGLKNIVLKLFDYNMRELSAFAKFSDGIHIERVPARDVAVYACDDAFYNRKVHQAIYPMVKDEWLLKVEMAVSPIVATMEENGVPFDKSVCEEQLGRLKEFAPTMQELIYDQVERAIGKRKIFDLNSPAKVAIVLFEDMQLPVLGRSQKTHKPSTAEKYMEPLAKDFDVVNNILTYRKLVKAETGYLQTLPTYIHPNTNCIHSTYHQGGVPTGRFASSHPNNQNWSKETIYTFLDNGREIKHVVNIRDCVRCADDEILVSVDYKQIEFHVALEKAQQYDLLDKVAEGHDIHIATASLVYKIPIASVDKKMRQKAKTRNYAMIYMETPQSAAQKEGIPVPEMERTFDEYFRALWKLKKHRDEVIEFARKNLYIKTHFGRKVDLEQLYTHPDRTVRAKGDRLAYNAECQGTAADIVKIAMVRCAQVLKLKFKVLPLIHNGHDSLTFIIKITVNLIEFVNDIRYAMEFEIPGFRLKPRIDVEVGQSYGHLIEYNGETSEQVIKSLIGRKVQKEKPEEEKAPERLRVKVNGELTKEQILAFKGLLTVNPGKNLVFIELSDGKVISLDKLPTSLGIRDKSRFELIFSCAVTADTPADYLKDIADNLRGEL